MNVESVLPLSCDVTEKLHSLHTFPFYFISSQWIFHTIKIEVPKVSDLSPCFDSEKYLKLSTSGDFLVMVWIFAFPNFSEIATATAFSESKCFGIEFSVELPLARFHLKTYIFSPFFCRFSFFFVFYTYHHERRRFMLFINWKNSISYLTNKYRAWPIFYWAYLF